TPQPCHDTSPDRDSAGGTGHRAPWVLLLLGPAPERTMAFCDDPSHHWLRQAWAEQQQDPRCPMTSATGRIPIG
ncbi:MAG: hypothetical protein ACKOE2_00895, partial [Actinomycetales bacterium]